MAVSIKKLSNNLHIAMRRRIMAEVKRRAAEKPAQFRTEKNFAAAERLVDNALREAAKRYPIPVKITLSRILFQNPLTAGIIKQNEDDIKRYIRLRVFKCNPGLREEVEEAEEILEKAEPIDPAQARSLNDVRQKVLRLITMKNLNEWKLSAFQRQSYFESINDMVKKCFPFITHPFFQRFLGDFDCESIEDLQAAYALIKSRLGGKKSETIFGKYKDRKIKVSSKDKFSLEDILSRFERNFYARWATGKYYLRIGRGLSREELFDIFLTFVIYRDRSRERVTAELHRINKTLDYLNEGVIKLNCSWVKKYGMGLFVDLFGMSCEEYIRSVLFWAARPK